LRAGDWQRSPLVLMWRQIMYMSVTFPSPSPLFGVKLSFHKGWISRASRKRLIANGLNCKVVKKNDLAELAVFARPILAVTKSVVISGI
jgi:hypothetical protein